MVKHTQTICRHERVTRHKSNFENQTCLRFYIWFVMSLHYKMRQRFYYKMQQSLLQFSSSVLLQNVTVLLQNFSVITKCIDLDATLKSLFCQMQEKLKTYTEFEFERF